MVLRRQKSREVVARAGRKGNAELINGHRGSLLQDEDTSEDQLQNKVNRLNITDHYP